MEVRQRASPLPRPLLLLAHLCVRAWCAVDMGRYGGAPSLAAIEEEVASGHVTAIVHVRGGAVG